MSKVEPMELIENPLANEDAILTCPLTVDILPKNKRHSVENSSNFSVVVRTGTNNEEPSSNRYGLTQSQSHHLIGTGGRNRGNSGGSVKIVDGGGGGAGGGGGTTRNRHSSGCLPTDPLLSPSNSTFVGGGADTQVSTSTTTCSASQQQQAPLKPKTLQTRLEDDGYCSSFISNKNSTEGLHPHGGQTDGGGGGGGGGGGKNRKNHEHVLMMIRQKSDDSPLDPNGPGSDDDGEDDGEGGEERETWSQGIDFLLSIIGFAVDLANVWRFPYYCYKNGGGAFLIPYFLMLALSAIPVFYMELLLGQSIRQGPISMWKICPLFKGIGYCAVTVSYFVSFYYNTIMGWSLHYTVHSFLSPLPWTTCNNKWNSENCFIPPTVGAPPAGVNASDYLENRTSIIRPPNATSPASEYFRFSVLEMQDHSIDNLGSPKLDLLLCLFVIYCLLYVILFRGIRSTGKVVWVTATLPYAVMAILLVRGLMLEGASDGIYYYLVPNMTKLTEVGVWSDAAKQIFFSSGAGFGVHLTYASYNPFHNNCYRDCLITSMVNCFTSIFAGFVIFTYLGSMATTQGRHISEVVNVGPGLVFEVYPEAVGTLPGANFWSLLFFLMLIMLGIDSAMGGLECVITGIMDEFKSWFKRKKHSREWFMFVCVFGSFLISIINVTRGGMYTFTFFDTYAAGSSLLFAVFFEVIVVSWVYGLDQLCKDAEAMIGHAPGIYWRICWKFVSPLLIAVIIVLDLSTQSPLVHDDYKYPSWAQVFGYVFTFIPITLVPIIGLTEFFKYPGSCKQKLAYSVTPVNEHPAIKECKYVKRFQLPHWLYFW